MGAQTSPDPQQFNMVYARPPALDRDPEDPTHTANFGVKLQEKFRHIGVESELVYPGAPELKHATVEDYLIEKMKAPSAK